MAQEPNSQETNLQESNSQENKDTTTNKVMPNGVVKRSQNPRGNFPWPLGLTLIEAAMVLSIAAVVIAGVMTFYLLTNNNRKMTATTEMIMSIVQEVESIYAQSPTFADLTVNTIMHTSAVPTQYRGTNVITTPLGGGVGIYLAPSGADFLLQIQSLNKEQCINAAKLDLGNSVTKLQIDNRTTALTAPSGAITTPSSATYLTGGSPDVGSLVGACNTGVASDVTWTIGH